ncbi:hypothetical protein M408DRAFT_327707 [Serendipita vermifera MAFF 305830]|uniref:BTB domain-containing protein n=1 Tax=Serendipita vermifera MAFF 305830 TaxID=933852 RepID=A0A0C3BJ36_SERVB|nr:hypothetical protein M408DRAFT_327707 [Serendipita vermifera MAFF 305830]
MDKPNTAKDSTKFPPGYGDFALQCSDGIVCHFPRHLLGYMSGFFKDMFELPESMGDVQSTDPLRLTEPSETIELLLQYMDPKIKTPKFEQSTIVDLLEVARKYQVPTVTTWFREEILLTKTNLLFRIRGFSLLLDSPLLILYCALRFDLPDVGQLALKILACCDITLLESSNLNIDLRHYLHIMSLRKNRIELLTSFVKELTEVKQSSLGFLFAPDASRIICETCAAVRASWVFNLRDAIDREPSLNSFLSAYDKHGGSNTCSKCKTSSWADYYREYIDRWRPKANHIEGILPEWPAWFSY